MGADEFEVVVVGVGSMGSMALWRLARRGVRALGIEQFEPGHDRGSGHGESRIIRTAYYEGPEYVPLIRSAFQLWRELESESGRPLLTMTGALMIGRLEDELIRGVLRSVEEHGLEHELMDHAEARRRHPQHRLLPSEVALFERDAGVLRPEAAVRAAAARAVELGAELVTGRRVTALSFEEGGVAVRAGDMTYRAERAVVSPGAWLPTLLPELALPIQIERQVQVWFPAEPIQSFLPESFPVFMHEREGRLLYGLPSLDGSTVKAAIHHEGRAADPDQLEREVTEAELRRVSELVAERLEGVAPAPARAAVCMYSNSADYHFIVGPHPQSPETILLGGFSGHGFKFAPVIGEAAAQWAASGATRLPIGGFSPTRFASGRER
jgi:sarcosine oxidase